MVYWPKSAISSWHRPFKSRSPLALGWAYAAWLSIKRMVTAIWFKMYCILGNYFLTLAIVATVGTDTYIRDFLVVIHKCRHFGKEDARIRGSVDEDYLYKLCSLAEGSVWGATNEFPCSTRRSWRTACSWYYNNLFCVHTWNCISPRTRFVLLRSRDHVMLDLKLTLQFGSEAQQM